MVRAAKPPRSRRRARVDSDARLSIATGNTTGVYYSLGGALAEAIGKSSGGKLKATAAETSASLQNIQQLVAGTHQVAFSLADTAADAAEGKESFDSPQPIAALARLYPNYTQVVARTDSGINSIADMRGKRVSTGAPNSGTEVIANRMLQAAGLDPSKDIQAQRTELGKTVEGMKDGSIDAMFWSGGLPTSGITDLFTSQRGNVKFIDVAGTLDKLKEINTIYEQGVIPAATYQTPGDVPTVVVPNLLLVKEDMDGNTACVRDQGAVREQGRTGQGEQGGRGHQPGHGPPDRTRSVASGCQEGTRRTRREELTEREDDDGRPEPAGGTATKTTTAAAAAYEEEKPARELTGWVSHAVTAVCVLIGVFAIYQVFFPLAQGNQVSLIYFLAAVLPLTLLCYRSGIRLRRKATESEDDEHDDEQTTKCRSAIRRSWTGCLPRSRWWLACTRCFPSKSQAAEEDSTSSSAGRAPPR